MLLLIYTILICSIIFSFFSIYKTNYQRGYGFSSLTICLLIVVFLAHSQNIANKVVTKAISVEPKLNHMIKSQSNLKKIALILSKKIDIVADKPATYARPDQTLEKTMQEIEKYNKELEPYINTNSE